MIGTKLYCMNAARVFLIGLLALSCGRRSNFTSPTEPPAAQAETPNGKSLRTSAPITQPLRVAGNRFSVELRGIIGCCFDGNGTDPAYTLPHGWPLWDESGIKEFSSAGANYFEIRPLTADQPFETVTEIVRLAQQYGLYVGVDVMDIWAFRNHVAPWIGDSCETTQEAPKEKHRRWIFDLVKATGAYPNVVYLAGNEAFTCDVSSEWELGVRDLIVAAEQTYGYDRHLIGTNSERPELEKRFDFSAYHQETAIGAGPVPRIINEYRRITPGQYRYELAAAKRQGTYFVLWRGPMTDAEWTEAKGYLK